MDPQSTSDGRPYGPIRYKQIVKECYIISKNAGISYDDVMGMTPAERGYILEFISDECEKSKELFESRLKKD